MARTIESAAIGVRYVRLTRILSWIGFAGVAGAVIGGDLLTKMTSLHMALLFATYLLWLVPWSASYILWFLEPKQRGRITVEADGAFRIERGRSSQLVPRGQVASAQAVVRLDGTKVEIVLANGNLFTVAVPSIPDADALVAALGFGPGGRRQRFELGTRKRRFLHFGLGFLAYQATSMAAMPLMIFAMIFGANALFPWFTIAVVLALPFVYRFFRKRATAPALEIGDDGLVLTSGTKPPRFFSRAEVYGAQVVANTGNITMNTALGPVAVRAISLDAATARAAIHAIDGRWTATATQATLGPRTQAFARSGRPVDAWRAELASRIAAPGYRGDGLTVEEADAVVRNPTAPAEARIGAALALAAVGERIRIADAAAPVADQRLRVALESVANGQEDPAMLEAATEPAVMRAQR